jgi:hypothetical protein
VEVYTTPYEAYDIEIVTDEGQTKGLVEGVHPEQIEVPRSVSLKLGLKTRWVQIPQDHEEPPTVLRRFSGKVVEGVPAERQHSSALVTANHN